MHKNYQGRKYEVKKYDSIWKTLFQKEKDILQTILGRDAIKIEHIGSTAVPGLPGKPTIDVLVVMNNLSRIEQYLSKMVSAGYQDLGEYVRSGTQLFVREKNGTRLVNIHFFPEGHPHIAEMLAVREYLRNHPREATAYGELKQKLAVQYPENYGAYRKEKDIYMTNLLSRARDEN